MAPARARATASAVSRAHPADARRPAGAFLERRGEIGKRLGEKQITRQSGRRDRALDVVRRAFHFQQHVHRGIPLEAQRRFAEPELFDGAVDPQHDFVAEPSQYDERRSRIVHARLPFLAVTVSVALPDPTLPAEDAPFSRPVGRMENSQPYDLIPFLQSTLAIEAAVEHRPPIHELRTRGNPRAPDGLRVLAPRFELALVARDAHENSAAR